MPHQKPTQEELDKNIEETINQLESTDETAEDQDDSAETTTDTPDDSESDDNGEATDDDSKSTSETDDNESSDEKEDKVELSKEEQDKKAQDNLPSDQERLRESTREAQILAAKNRKTQESIQQAFEIPAPTDEELRLEFPEWEDMSAVEQRLAKNDIWNTRKLNKINEAAQEGKDIDAWSAKVDTFIEDPAVLADNPELDGKQSDFKLFAGKETRRGVPFEDLVSAFLYDVSKNAKPKQKGQMFETGTGGDKKPPKRDDGKLTVEEGDRLRDTNYNKWREYLKAGKISEM